MLAKVRLVLRSTGKGGALQVAEEPLHPVILSEAKNLGSCSFNELQRSFVACDSSG